MKLDSSDRICRIDAPLTWTTEKVELMVRACAEIARFHYEHSPDIRSLYDRKGFSPDSIRTEKDIARIPPVMVSAMKRYLLTCKPESQAALMLTSSGTRGQKTQVWFDAESLERAQATLDVLWAQEGLVSTTPTNYLMFVYAPDDAGDLGIAFSCKNEQRFAPAKETFFAIHKNREGNWFFDKEALFKKALAFASQGLPVRLDGIPSFLHEFIAEYRSRGPVRLAPGSLVMTGGGWKAAEGKKTTREQFRALITEFFGIPDELIRDGYGMAEHSAPYVDCKAHRFHVPVYCRVIVRDPVTLEVLPPGRVGLLELVCPYNTMMANLAILSTDMGTIDPEPCGCGRNAPTFTLTGRAGLTKFKGCSLTADEIVRR